jgi:hypothetical protein
MDQPPYAVGDGALTPAVPEKNVPVTLTMTTLGAGGSSKVIASAITDSQGNYRMDNITVANVSTPCSGGPTFGSVVVCTVSVAGATGIEDSRQVFLGNDPSTTVQDLDWGHIPDRHALSGTISGPVWADSEIKVVAQDKGGSQFVVGQTATPRCLTSSAQGCSGRAWRLESVVAPAAMFVAGQRAVEADVQLIERANGTDVIVDSATMTIPVAQPLPSHLDPYTAAVLLDTTDLTAPTLQAN